VGVVSKPIQKRSRQLLIAEDLGPIAKAEIGRHNHRHPFIERGTELKDQMRAVSGQGNKAQLVQDDQLVLEQLGQELGQSMLILSLSKDDFERVLQG